MKKFIYSIAMLAAALTAASCVQEEAPVVDNEVSKDAVVFSATFSATPASKATLTSGAESSTVAWEENDEVIIFDGTDWYDYVATPDTENKKNATLSPKTESASVAGKYHALFLHPEGAEATIDGDVITTTLPAVQVAVPNTFATHLAVAKSPGNSFAFKNVCGLVRVTLTTTDVLSVVLEGLNDEVVAGGIKINVSDEPTWEVDGANGSKTVTLKAEGDVAIVPGVYFFAVLPQAFENGFKVTINRAAGDPVVRTTAAGVTVERCQIVKGNANSVLGAGTESNPYVLMTAEDMCQMKVLTNRGEMTYFQLGADIDMTEVTSWETINGTSPYDRYIHFDGAKKANAESKGDCYTISNFAPTTITGGWPSFFGVLNGTVQNVNFESANITSSSNGTGLLGGSSGAVDPEALGTKPSATTIINVHASGSVNLTGSIAGGFLGRAQTKLIMTDCTSSVNVSASAHLVGGMVAYVNAGAEVTNCSVSGTVTGTTNSSYRVGGLIGQINAGASTIVNCHTTGAVNGAYLVGGLVGDIQVTNTTLTNCYHATGLVSSTYRNTSNSNGQSGGLVGYSKASTYTGCYVLSNVTGSQGHIAGGLVGTVASAATFSKCYFNGVFTNTAGNQYGALIGRSEDNIVITDSYAVGSMSVNSTKDHHGGIIGYISSGMASVSTSYTDLNISNTRNSVGGIIGNFASGVTAPSVAKCIVWGTPAKVSGGASSAVDCVVKDETCTTISAAATNLEWDTTIWDLSGDFPVLK